MTLVPCASCRRHVDAGAPACVFCGAPNRTAPSAMRAVIGRVSRAAVFAGVAACAPTTPPVQHPPPPPPPDPVIVQQFATAPPPAAGKASIRGFATRDGRPLAGVTVHAQFQDGTQVDVTTGEKGEFSLADVAPGHWTLALDDDLYDPYRYSRNPHQGSPRATPDVVDLVADQNVRHDISLVSPPPPEPDRGPCCKPYGAPPARRRVV